MIACEVNWQSQVLRMQVTTRVLLPETGSGPFPTYYLLHGLSDDHTGWHRRTRVEIYGDAYPMIIVMPQGFRGFYTDNDQGPEYAKYIGEELPAMIERNFPAQRTRHGRCIGGLSMGGYGALRIALGYPDRFISANSHCGPLMHGQKPKYWRAATADEFLRIFGARPKGSSHDLTALARKAKARGRLPRMLIDCGTEDALLAANREFHGQLEDLRVPHEYREFPGGHDWNYWEAHISDALRFHAKVLGIERK